MDGVRDSSHNSNASQLSLIQEVTQGMMESVVQAVRKAGDDHERKLDAPPVWDQGTSIEGWSHSVLIWAESKAKQEQRVQTLVEMLKKEKREMIVAEVVETQSLTTKMKMVLLQY